MEPRPARVNAGSTDILMTDSHCTCEKSMPSLRKKGIGKPDGISPMVSLSSKCMHTATMVITTRATNVDGTFLVMSGKR